VDRRELYLPPKLCDNSRKIKAQKEFIQNRIIKQKKKRNKVILSKKKNEMITTMHCLIIQYWLKTKRLRGG